MGLGTWLFKPVADLGRHMYQYATAKPEEIQIAGPIEDKEPSIVDKAKSKIYRPLVWSEYIGQTKAKSIMKSYIKAMKERKEVLGHVLIHGKAGTGKTTLAKIITNEMQVPMRETITSTIEGFEELEMMLLEDLEPGSAIFLDEIHALERNVAESLYSVMEDFEWDGESVERFTLIGATTELGEIIKNRKPFYDRFKIIIELEDYTTEEMIKIVKQYKKKVFPNDRVRTEWYEKAALNCRAVPRRAIRLIEACIYLKSVDRALDNLGIIKDGYTYKDLKALEYIKKCKKGVGMQSIAAFLNTSVQNYLYEIEPYLLQSGVLIRATRGRQLTDDGIMLIETLNQEVANGNSS